MGYGDDLIITPTASKVKKQNPEKQIIIGDAKKKHAFHSVVYDNNPDISDCRNLEKNKPIQIIDYHTRNRPYIDYQNSTNSNYVWRKFKPKPGKIYFSKKEIIKSKEIISNAKNYWKLNNKKNYKNIIFLETSSTKINDRQFGIKQRNLDWGEYNWRELINRIKKNYLLIQSVHNETKNNFEVFTPDKMDFRTACAVLNEVDLFVGTHGGLGHAAAALNKKAVLYFGGWISPETMAYDFHENIYYENKLSPCGQYGRICDHCEKARKSISVDIFIKHIIKSLD
tara:strand:+ start:102 stop:950 length:849 start_codon:yes stop_codon:yes gene_type:complete